MAQEVLQEAIDLDAQRWKQLRDHVENAVGSAISKAFG